MSELATKLADIRKERAGVLTQYETICVKDAFDDAVDGPEADRLRGVIKSFDERIERINKARELVATTAQVANDGLDGNQGNVDHNVVSYTKAPPAAPETDPYTKKDGLIIGAITKMAGLGGGNLRDARMCAKDIYGERHPVTRALNTSIGSAGGFIIPPDYMNEIIELLRPRAVVRSSGPRNIPMPRGTMVLPGQASAAVATYGTENATLATSQQTLDQINASYKKLTALVPVTNDMMRYADPAVDAFVRDDLVKVIALREDLAFLTGDGTSATPVGYTGFANRFAVSSGGVAGVWSSVANSVLATSGNWITSNETYTLATAAAELGGLINKLDTANVPDIKRAFFFHPRTKNYLYNVQNAVGAYVYRDEMRGGTLLGYKFYCSTQIPINLYDATGTNTDCSFIFMAELDETMILDSMQLELAVSRDGTYIDASGNTVSAFSNDQTLIRAITEHDFQLRHSASIAIAQNVRWAPAIS